MIYIYIYVMIDMRHNWDTQAKNGTHNQQYDVWVDPKLGGETSNDSDGRVAGLSQACGCHGYHVGRYPAGFCGFKTWGFNQQ